MTNEVERVVIWHCVNCGYKSERKYENHSCVGRLMRQKESLQFLVDAYRNKMKVDGLNGRKWSASQHYEAEQEVNRLEAMANRAI